jgi:hypothetical protein
MAWPPRRLAEEGVYVLGLQYEVPSDFECRELTGGD